MKKILAVFLSVLLTCSMFITCFTFSVSADAPAITIDGLPDDSIWSDAFWNKVDKTNGKFQATYTNGLPDFAYEWAVELVDDYLYLFVMINQGPHMQEGVQLSNTTATNVRLWVDSDMSDTVRTTLFDFTYNGTGCEVTRADKVNNVDYDKSQLSCALTSGENHTYFEIAVPLDSIAYDPAKQFGIFLSVSDINLKDSGEEYDALNCAIYGSGEEPWKTTKLYKSVYPCIVDGKLDDNLWGNVVWNRVDKNTGKFQATYTNDLPDFAYDWAVAKVKGNLYVAVKINQAPNKTEGGQLNNMTATNVRLWVDNDMSNTARTTLFDITYNGAGCEVTRADAVNGVDYDKSLVDCALDAGEDYTVFEIALPLDSVGYDPNKQFGIFLSVSDINLKDSGEEYDALNCAKYESGEEPWNSTKLFKPIIGYDVDVRMPDVVVSTGKTYTGTKAERSGWEDTDPATKLTDGDVGTLNTLGGSGPFVGFQVKKNVTYKYTSGAWAVDSVAFDPDERDEDGNFYVIIDLGEKVEAINTYSVKFGQITAYGILFPSKVQFFVSNNGVTFDKIGDGVQGTVEDNGAATLKEWADYTFTSSSGVTARYIKVVITPAEFTDEMTPAPVDAGNEGDEKVVSKVIVTALSEITVSAKATGGIPEYSDIPVKKNGYPIDYVTSKNTSYPAGYGNYTADLTDDVAHNAGSYDNKWYAFYYNNADGKNTVNGVGTITVNLGDIKNVSAFRVHVWQPVSSGIGIPEITVLGSFDNYGWLEIGKLQNPTGTIGWATLELDYELPVKYIRFDVRQIADKQVFVFINEIEVLYYLHESTFSADFANQYSVGYQNPGTWTYNGGGELAGVGDAVYIYTPDKGRTLGEAANPGIAWWQVWVIDFDTEANCYYIKEFHPVNGGSPKGGIEIPEKGFVIASSGHGNLSFDPILTTSVAIGAPVYVYGIDMQNLGVKDTMDFVNENIFAVFAPIDGLTPFIPDFTPDLPEGALKIDNFADYVGSTLTIMTRIGDKITIGEVSAETVGAAKDYNYFYLVAVDKNNRVVEINHKLGRKGEGETELKGEKDGFVIPEGGYVLLCNANVGGDHTQAVIDAFLAIKVGDIITLYNVDLEALAAGGTRTDLHKAGFTVTEASNVTNLSDPDKVEPTKGLAVLTDGKKDLENASKGFGDAQVVLFMNKTATTAGVYPTVELLLNLGEAKTFNTVDLSFYVEYISMIGLPKDGKVTISYGSDADNLKYLATYTFDGEVKSGDKGVRNVSLVLGTALTAQYVKIDFSYGDSPFQDKPVWEWIALTEVGVSTTAIPDLPAGALKINNFADYVGSTMTIITRIPGKTKLGEISELTTGTVKDYNYFYLVAVDANNKVIAINQTLGRPDGVKTDFEVPEGGYVLLCNGNAGGDHTQAVIDAFKAIKVGDTITLYNVDLAALETMTSKLNLEKAGFTVTEASNVTNLSDPDKVEPTKGLAVLTDGKKDLENASKGFGDAQVVLFMNKTATTAGVYPTVELLLNLGEAKTFNTVDLSFYVEYISMIGLPKDGKVTISYGSDADNLKYLATYTFDGEVKSGDKGVRNVSLVLGTALTAQYVKIDFSYGDSPFQDKPVWEWIALTEVGVSTTAIPDLPAGALKINNFADYVGSTMTIITRIPGKTKLGEISELTTGTVKDYNYFYLVAVDANNKVIAINQTLGRPDGVKTDFEVPEGGYVLLCNGNAGGDHTQAVIDAFKAIKVGDTITLYNVDLAALETMTSKLNLEKAGFTVTAGEPEPSDPFELKEDVPSSIEIADGMLLGITDTMTVEDIKALFVGEVTVERVGTGATITAGGQTIVMVIYGDVDGDGIIDSTDYLIVKRMVIGNSSLTGAYLKAASPSGDDEPSSYDCLLIKRHIVGTSNLFA